MTRAIQLKPLDKERIKRVEQRFTLNEAVEKLHEMGYALRSVDKIEKNVYLGPPPLAPQSYVARLKTACGAVRDEFMPMPPVREIRKPVTALRNRFDVQPGQESSESVTYRIRRFVWDLRYRSEGRYDRVVCEYHEEIE